MMRSLLKDKFGQKWNSNEQTLCKLCSYSATDYVQIHTLPTRLHKIMHSTGLPGIEVIILGKQTYRAPTRRGLSESKTS